MSGFGEGRAAGRAANALREVPATGAAQGAEGGRRRGGGPEDDPPAVREAFRVEVRPDGERRYWAADGRARAGEPALRVTPAGAIEARGEDGRTVRAALDLAEARGWRSVEATGSAAFRREAWIEARARGMEAEGHAPSRADREEAAARRAERIARGGDRPAPDAGRADGERGLSADGRLLLAAIESKVARELRAMGTGAIAELNAFAAAELARRERLRGPVELTPEQRWAAASPEPPRRGEPDAPRRVPGR